MKISIKNSSDLQQVDSNFNIEKCLNGNLSMTFDRTQRKRKSEDESEVGSLIYKLNGEGAHYQRISLFSFRNSVRFVKDTPANRKTLKAANKSIADLIIKKGATLSFKDLEPTLNKIDALSFESPFTVAGDVVTIPDEIEVLCCVPKLNIGLFDYPMDSTKIRYLTKAYKNGVLYAETDTGYQKDKKGDDLPFIVKELIRNSDYDKLISLHDVAELNPIMGKSLSSVIFNGAICLAKHTQED